MSFRIGCTSYFISATLNDDVGDKRRQREKPSLYSSRYQRALRLNEMEDVRLGAKIRSLEQRNRLSFERLREEKKGARHHLRQIRTKKCNTQYTEERNKISMGFSIGNDSSRVKEPLQFDTRRDRAQRAHDGFKSFRRDANLHHAQCLVSSEINSTPCETSCEKQRNEKCHQRTCINAQKDLTQQTPSPFKLTRDFDGKLVRKEKESSNRFLARCLPPLPETQIGFSDPEVGSISPPESPLPLRGRQARNAQGMTRILIAEAMSWNQRRWKFRAPHQ